MRIFNTMTKKKEELTPGLPGQISIYACGPTVYHYFHIGNARPFIVFDTLRRYLEYLGYQVRFVQNFTDIDDKMIRRANEEGMSVKELGDRFIEEYYRDADALNIKRASVNPRATQHIQEILHLVKTLIEKGHAYPTPAGDVYFHVRSFADYGKLSGQDVDDLASGARVEPGDAKKDPLDFALWKAAKPGEPSWESPWGLGRPGWHVECSAMSMALLGETFDIHAGGQDLIFPHHENEIAQSEAATGRPFAKYWMHNGYINVNNQKMSKSAGNFFTVRDILERFDPNAVRLFLLSAHYRSPVNFSGELLEQAHAAHTRLLTAKERLFDAIAQSGATKDVPQTSLEEVKAAKAAFQKAMDDDLNTADALGVLFEFVRNVNTRIDGGASREWLDAALLLFDEMTGVLGVAQGRLLEEIPEAALDLLERRQEARAQKDWARADEIRAQLTEMGFLVEDSREGAKLKRA